MDTDAHFDFQSFSILRSTNPETPKSRLFFCNFLSCLILALSPPVDLHWFFEISIRTEKKFQLKTEEKFSQHIMNFFFSSH